jgi:hypothetical protein
MSQLRHAAAVGLIVFCGATAQAEDGSRSLDSASTGKTKSLGSAAGSESVGLDAAKTEPSAPAPLPDIDDDALRSEAQAARDAVLAAQERSAQADAAYSKMRSRDYPQGDARAAIVKERSAAREAYATANARYQDLLNQLR